jgi:hypothetical protein
VKLKKVLQKAEENVVFIESLAKKYAYDRGWAKALRGALLARTGSKAAALKHFSDAEEAALRISNRSCLCYTFLERGYVEDRGGGAGLSASGSVVSPEAAAGVVRSFTAAAELASECGLEWVAGKATERISRLMGVGGGEEEAEERSTYQTESRMSFGRGTSMAKPKTSRATTTLNSALIKQTSALGLNEQGKRESRKTKGRKTSFAGLPR